MSELEVRMVRLGPMRVATAPGFGQTPTPLDWATKELISTPELTL